MAAMRLEDLKDWIDTWQLSEMYAEVGGKGVVDAWHDALTRIEEYKLTDQHFCGAVADIAKFFDQIRRELSEVVIQ